MNALLESSIAGENVQGRALPVKRPFNRTSSDSRVRRSGAKSHPAHRSGSSAQRFFNSEPRL